MQQKQQRPTSIVSIYASSDIQWLERWEAHLRPLEQAGIISAWSVRHLQAGLDREATLQDHLDQADTIVLLLSADFFTDDECYSLMEHALVRHQQDKVRVIPLLLRPVAFRETKLAAFTLWPSDGRPIVMWENPEAAFDDCVRELRRILGRPTTQPIATRKKQTSVEEQNHVHMFRRLRPSSRKRVLVWVLSLTTLAIAVFVTTDFTNLGSAPSSFIGNLFSSPGLPVRIDSVHRTRYLGGDTHAFANALVLSDTELSQLNALNQTDPSYEAWFASRHAVDTNVTSAELVVEGNRNHTVRITDLEPIVSCQSPLTGTLFFSPPAGADTSTQLLFDLDNPHAVSSYTTDRNGTVTSGKDFFGTYTVSLKQGEQFTFEVVASTAKHFCQFTLAMTVVDGTKTITETITNNEQPFQVTTIVDNHPMTHGEFSAYQVLYIGGVLSPGQNRFYDGLWTREDPKTFCTLTNC